MTPQLATKLVTVLDFKVMKVLEEYIDHRVGTLRATTESSDNLNDIKFAQGGINELRKLLKLREDVMNIIELAKEG